MYDWGCCEDGELSILRRKVVDGSFLRNFEVFCLCIFIINIGGWLEKSKWNIVARIRMIGVVTKMVNYRF